MRVGTIGQCRRIDELSQTEYGVPSDLLMESAGALSARTITQTFIPELKRGFIDIVCGPGNNGADGLVVARHLHSAGQLRVRIFVVGHESKRSILFKTQLERVFALGLPVIDVETSTEALSDLHHAGVIVDALFGIGFRGTLEGSAKKVVEVINETRAAIVSLDTPSGLDCDRGTVSGICVRATMTLTFGLAKPGFFVNEGPSRVGSLRILPIGFPLEVMQRQANTIRTFDEHRAYRYLPKRKASSNKSSHGHAVVFAGSDGMWGAGILAALSAFRVGTGYVTLAGKSEPLEALQQAPEVFTTRFDNEKLWQEKKWTAAAIGPGLGADQETAGLITRLRDGGTTKVVVDADAITACVKYNLFPLPSTWVLTPHAGELAKVLNLDAKAIESDRFQSAMSAAKLTGCNVLLKGYRTVLANGKKCVVILSGNSALAKAGTGDVLTGMIAGLMAQNVESAAAAATAAYIHGRMADEWVKSGRDRRSLVASDIANHLPTVLASLRR